MPPKTLIDPFGRTVDYIRVSVTDRCDFRCVYCMAEHMTFLPKAELLSLEELEQVCRNFMALRAIKLRQTCSNSSNDNNSAFGKKVICSAMQ